MRVLRALLLAVCLLICVSAVAQDSRAEVSFGYSYLNNEEPTGPRISMNGWYALAKINVNPWFAALADFTGFYGTNPTLGVSEKINGFTFGPCFTLPTKSKIKPFGFLELGDIRDANQNSRAVDVLGVVVGGGFSVAMSKHVGLLIVPAEYVMAAPKDGPYNNFSAKIGISIPLWRKK